MDSKKYIKVNGARKKTRLYDIWIGMRARCRNTKLKSYPSYGGRGITVCREWDSNFYAFHKWSKENGYRGNLSIDRNDNDGNYCPSNCSWVNKWTQTNNRGNTIMLVYKDEERSISYWARVSGLRHKTLYRRIFIYGWPTEYAMDAPLYAPGPPDAKPREKPEPIVPDEYGF